jgi:LuxR family maltose regulon positive regulatory protein
MPRAAKNSVIWSAAEERYEISITRSWGTGKLGMQPDGPEWFAWLQGISSFAFQCREGHFTARKEARHRGSKYWVAYLRLGDKLTKRYIGPTEAATIARLEHIARDLQARVKVDRRECPAPGG